MYVTRTLEPHLHTITQHFPVLWLTGARQVGKTILLRQIKEPERAFVTLDDPLVRQLAQEDPALFMQRFSPPVLIDEVQYAPELLPYIKMAVDEARRPGLFWLTGSQQFRLMQGVSESLAGRVAIVQLAGLSLAESQGRGVAAAPFTPMPVELRRRREACAPLTLMQVCFSIWRGSLPAIALNPTIDHALFYGSYTQTYLQRDVRDLARVGDETAFLRFLWATAARTCSLLNLSDLARDADITHNTARSWLAILESSGIVYLLEPYHTNLSKRLVKAPKLYFLDTGLAAYLTGWVEGGGGSGVWML